MINLMYQYKLKLNKQKVKKKGSNNWLKLQKKMARLHETVANTRKDWHFKLANNLCNLAENIFVEDINFSAINHESLGGDKDEY